MWDYFEMVFLKWFGVGGVDVFDLFFVYIFKCFGEYFVERFGVCD